MGEHSVSRISKEKSRAEFIRHLLNDIEALELMVKNNLIENDITRIGSEQEFCLVEDNWRPSKKAQEILKTIDDPHFTTELALYNLEINLDPHELKTDCFSKVEHQLKTLLAKAKTSAAKHNNKVVLAGILPSIGQKELEFDYMTPHPRYWALNDTIKELRGSDFKLRIRGVDELSIHHDSVLFEACNTSFQLHLQIAPEDFISSYNWSQAISGPILGISSNSPLLLGRELWSETRIALFQQSIDTRISSFALKDQHARVSFGGGWAQGNVASIFKSDIARHKVILSRTIESNSLQDLEDGKIPKLEALCLNNSTIYRWNRPCYGVGGGKAHLRIENRYIPSGPSTIDEIANFAFWVGLMAGRPAEFDDIRGHMDFRDAKANFFKAARNGKESVMFWMENQISVRDLVTKELLPMAQWGLEKVGIDNGDIERLLAVIDKRTSGMIGAKWNIRSYRKLREELTQDDALLALTKSIYDNQQTDMPVHKWPLPEKFEKAQENALQVRHIMSTRLYTINENDLADLATSVMRWKDIHHVPVENNAGDLCGLLTWTHMKRYEEITAEGSHKIVSNLMAKNVISVSPETKIVDAIRLMKKNEIGCLPIAHGKHLVGIITIVDVIPFDND
ncbi:MAG: CBS domain-containing protein [Cytophagales bacterium]|nr:CBS domain-containing protein [Cytophagales bacterium]